MDLCGFVLRSGSGLGAALASCDGNRVEGFLLGSILAAAMAGCGVSPGGDCLRLQSVLEVPLDGSGGRMRNSGSLLIDCDSGALLMVCDSDILGCDSCAGLTSCDGEGGHEGRDGKVGTYCCAGDGCGA